jgi:hypothetical protein
MNKIILASTKNHWFSSHWMQTQEVSLTQKYVNKTKLKFEALTMVITIKIDLWDMDAM